MGSSPSRPSSRMSEDTPNGNTNYSRPNTTEQGARNTRQPRSSVASAPLSARQVGFREVQLQTPVPDAGEGTERDQERNRHSTNIRPQRNDMYRREKTLVAADEQPTYSNDQGVVLETFYHQSNMTYRCMVSNGQRSYFDKNKEQWLPFPQNWLKLGFITTDKAGCSDKDIRDAEGRKNREQRGGGGARRTDASEASEAQNDREGAIYLPDKGRISTYISQERRKNVHTFFDEDQGIWVPLPLAWELQSDLVKKLLADIQEALPNWKDRCDMLATLRLCNYDAPTCISTYLSWDDACKGNKSSLVVGRNEADAKALSERDQQVAKLSKKVKSLEEQLEKISLELESERKARAQAEKSCDSLKDKLSEMEAENAKMAAHMKATLRPRTPVKQQPQRPAVDRKIIVSMERSTQSLHKDQARLKMDIKSAFMDFNKIIIEVTRGVREIRNCESGVGEELTEMKELYRREALQRKILYNQLQELRGNIRVFCRCRYDNRASCCLQFPSDTEVLPPGSKRLQFDKVFTPKSTQEDVYEDTKPLVTSCVDGYNVCILAYGQTGSGKTYTMQGTRDDPGVNVRALRDLLEICKARDNIRYQLKASMVEIYNETIHDLLSSKVGQLDIRAQGNKIVLPGITEESVESLDDIDHIIDMGQKNRSVAATKMNSQSSRSHLIFMITVRGLDQASGALSMGTLTLCDLAGSERVSKTEATGARLVEAASINKSLSSLGQVFTALRNGQLHIPYRNSKLTHILQPSLGGDAKACLFVMVSPDSSNLQESISTLQFGSNAQQVQLGQAKKNVVKGPSPSSNDDY